MHSSLPLFQAHQPPTRHIAEVIETSTTEFLAQCLEPEDLSYATMPPFGSWVKAMDEDSGNQIYAVVYHATTSPIDSVHRARALGLSLAELRDQQPQIFAMLKTEFRSAIVGFRSGTNQRREVASITGQMHHYLPPRPPQVHQAVYECEHEEVIAFSDRFDFLRILLKLSATPVDSLIAATMRDIYQLRKGDRPWLVNAGRHLSVLLKDDYDRLQNILSQIHLA